MQQQLLLGLDHPKRYEDELVYGSSNADIYDWMARYHEWPLLQTMIVGPEKSGKSTFAQLLATQFGLLRLNGAEKHSFDGKSPCKKQLFFNFSHTLHKAQLPEPSSLPPVDIVLDNGDSVPQEWLFHLINHQKLAQKRLIITSAYTPSEWLFETPDLASRMRSFYILQIQEMDDVLCERLLQKLLLERSIKWDSGAIDYLLKRIPRDYKGLFNLVAHMDRFLLGAHKRLTVVQARHFCEMDEEKHHQNLS